MTITRILTGVLAAVATAGTVQAQYTNPMPPYAAPGRPAGPGPSVFPNGMGDPAAKPPDAAANLERMTMPVPPGGNETADPVGTLTGQPGLPPGSYPGPMYRDAAGCCGPFGRNGTVAYELYVWNGPNLIFGSGAFTDVLNVGWGVFGGGRTLFFDRGGDAAWVLDLGLSYQYNRGNTDRLNVFVRTPPRTNPVTGAVIPQPDTLTTVRIRGLHRTAFNFAIGRDWWLWGPGNPGAEPGWNCRVGTDVGGRWGTSHVDMVPTNEVDGYARRQNVFEGVFIGFHTNVEVPLGGWVWFAGLRAEWSYDWTNLVPPLKGDIQNVNLLMTTGFRF